MMRLLALALLGSAPMSDADFELTSLARKRLAEEPQLASFNLGVRVRNGIAVLWGPAPSREAVQRAELTLRGLIELRDVRNEMFVDDEGWKPRYLPEAPRPAPSPPPPPLPTPELALNAAPSKVHKPAPPAAFTPQALTQLVASKDDDFLILPNLPLPAATGGSASTVPAPPSLSAPLLGLPNPGSPAVSTPSLGTPTLGTPTLGTPVPMGPNLEQRVQQLQQGNDRYRQVQVRVDGQRVVVSAAQRQSPALHALAREISQIHGVEQVIVQDK